MKKPLEDMSDKGLGGTILYFLIFYSEVSFINISIISCKQSVFIVFKTNGETIFYSPEFLLI